MFENVSLLPVILRDNLNGYISQWNNVGEGMIVIITTIIIVIIANVYIVLPMCQHHSEYITHLIFLTTLICRF